MGRNKNLLRCDMLKRRDLLDTGTDNQTCNHEPIFVNESDSLYQSLGTEAECLFYKCKKCGRRL